MSGVFLFQEPFAKPVITVKEARKLLGLEARNLSDDQVIEIIALFTLIAKTELRKIGANNTLGVNG